MTARLADSSHAWSCLSHRPLLTALPESKSRVSGHCVASH